MSGTVGVSMAVRQHVSGNGRTTEVIITCQSEHLGHFQQKYFFRKHGNGRDVTIALHVYTYLFIQYGYGMPSTHFSTLLEALFIGPILNFAEGPIVLYLVFTY